METTYSHKSRISNGLINTGCHEVDMRTQGLSQAAHLSLQCLVISGHVLTSKTLLDMQEWSTSGVFWGLARCHTLPPPTKISFGTEIFMVYPVNAQWGRVGKNWGFREKNQNTKKTVNIGGNPLLWYSRTWSNPLWTPSKVQWWVI